MPFRLRTDLPWLILAAGAVLALVLFNSACAETLMPRHVVSVVLDVEACSVYSLAIGHGEIRQRGPCRYDITFYEARGGISYFFGYPWNDRRPEVTDQVGVFLGDTRTAHLSYFDIVRSPSAYAADSCTIVHTLTPSYSPQQ